MKLKQERLEALERAGSQPTYEELKLSLPLSFCSCSPCSQPTYEELKPESLGDHSGTLPGSQPTYEELKPELMEKVRQALEQSGIMKFGAAEEEEEGNPEAGA